MRTILHFTFVLTIAGLLVSCGNDDAKTNKNTATQQTQAYSKTTPAQNKTSQSQVVQFGVTDLDGNYHSSDEWIGKMPVVINFWGTWCPPCRKELPDLVRLYSEYHPRGIEMLGLAVNDKPNKVRSFSQKMGMEWVMLMGDQAAGMFKVRGVPTTVFLNSEGEIVHKFTGMRNYEDLKKGFELIL
ncbi:MAG: TlpA disulfide reductase family protein [candidate division Zixibacteria bacterium]|nr:TlpA disulfide reductase family protein [candidate division Zixibacteria bacterium]